MAYDPLREKVVLYGGSSGTGKQHDDTWEFDGSTWTKVGNASQHGVKLRHTMVYDPFRKLVLLYGGKDLWGWDGVKWIILSNECPERIFSAVCFDAKRNKLVLFGGIDDLLRSDIWEWDNTGWKLKLDGNNWKWDDATEQYLLIKNFVNVNE